MPVLAFSRILLVWGGGGVCLPFFFRSCSCSAFVHPSSPLFGRFVEISFIMASALVSFLGVVERWGLMLDEWVGEWVWWVWWVGLVGVDG